MTDKPDTDAIEPQASQPDTVESRESKGTFLPLVFGGAMACALGFFGGQLDWVEERFGLQRATPALASDLDAQNSKIDKQSGALAELSTRIDEIAAAEAPAVDLAPVQDMLAVQDAQIKELAARLTEVEKQPMTGALSQTAIDAYQKELADLQSSVTAQRDEIASILDQARASESGAAEQAKRAMGRAALARIVAAVDAGTPFADAVADLAESGVADLPAALQTHASKGVPTLAQLQDGFPEVARAALGVSRANDDSANTVTGFLKRQLGARSVTPREGNDADAVLSRVEASVRQGRIGDALAELETLSEPATAVMADWIGQAKDRFDAQSAADALLQSLNTN